MSVWLLELNKSNLNDFLLAVDGYHHIEAILFQPFHGEDHHADLRRAFDFEHAKLLERFDANEFDFE